MSHPERVDHSQSRSPLARTSRPREVYDVARTYPYSRELVGLLDAQCDVWDTLPVNSCFLAPVRVFSTDDGITYDESLELEALHYSARWRALEDLLHDAVAVKSRRR